MRVLRHINGLVEPYRLRKQCLARATVRSVHRNSQPLAALQCCVGLALAQDAQARVANRTNCWERLPCACVPRLGGLPTETGPPPADEIGRASCRERVCTYV